MFLLLYVYKNCVCLYVCVPYVCQVLTEVRRGHWLMWNQSFRLLSAAMRVLGAKHGPSVRTTIVLRGWVTAPASCYCPGVTRCIGETAQKDKENQHGQRQAEIVWCKRTGNGGLGILVYKRNARKLKAASKWGWAGGDFLALSFPTHWASVLFLVAYFLIFRTCPIWLCGSKEMMLAGELHSPGYTEFSGRLIQSLQVNKLWKWWLQPYVVLETVLSPCCALLLWGHSSPSPSSVLRS